MVRAAARGVVDFRRARPLEANWWRRLNLLLDEVESDDIVHLAGEAFRFHMLTAANAALAEGSFKSAREAAQKLFKTMDSALRPWASDRDNEKGKVEIELYKQLIGDYRNDPAFRATVEAEAKAMLAAAEAAPTETEDQLYERRLMSRLREARQRRQRRH